MEQEAIELNNIGNRFNDSLHRFSVTVQDPGEELTIGFDSTLNQASSDENWGVDNPIITAGVETLEETASEAATSPNVDNLNDVVGVSNSNLTPTTISLDADNLNDVAGVSVYAQRLDSNGAVLRAANILIQENGDIGVEGNPDDPATEQIGFNPVTGEAEQIVIEFEQQVLGGEFSYNRFFRNEGDNLGGAGHEQAVWQAFSDNVLVAEATFVPEAGIAGTITIELPDGVTADKFTLTPTEYSGGQLDFTRDSSDFFLTSLQFDVVGKYLRATAQQ